MQRVVLDGVIFGLQNGGGISRFWCDLIKGLEAGFAKEHKVILLVPKNKNIEWAKIKETLHSIKIEPRRRFYTSKRSFFRKNGYLTALALKYRPTVWHSSYYVGFPWAFCSKKIASFYDMIPEVIGCASKKGTEDKRRSLAQSDHIVAISQSSCHDLAKFWPTLAKKSRVIPLCTQIKGTPAKSKPYLLFMGTRGGYKNFFSAAKTLLSASQFSNYALMAIGGELRLSPEEKGLLMEHRNRLSIQGPISPQKLQGLVAEATAVIYPSLYEGFGLPVLEAFASSVPVLACKTSSIVEITGSDYPLADPKNPKTFVNTLSQLLNHKEHWVAYGKRRERLFTFENMINRFTQLYAL